MPGRHARACDLRHKGSHLTSDSLRLSLVIPAFNEAARLADEAEHLHRAVVTGAIDPHSTELIVVDDGSSDDTARRSEHLFALSFSDVRVLRRDVNAGKGAAIRHGVAAARAPVVVFMDADMAVDPSQVVLLTAAIETADVAIGSRSAPGSIIESDNFRRTVMGRTFSRYVNALTGMGIVDTQCGFKAFRTPVARLLFHSMVIERFAFDVELLYLASRLSLRLTEVPVHWRDVGRSAVRPIVDPLSMVFDVVRLRIGRKTPPLPAISIPVDTGGRGQFRDEMLQALFDMFGPKVPIVQLAQDEIAILFPLTGDDDVRRATAQIDQLIPSATVCSHLLSLDELIATAPLQILTPGGGSVRTGLGDVSLDEMAREGEVSAHRFAPDSPSDEDPLSIPGT